MLAKNTESGIAFWVICCNWFSCTNLNALQTVLVLAGRILTTGEEQPCGSVYSAGKAYLRPKEVLHPSPVELAVAKPRKLLFPKPRGLKAPAWCWSQINWRAQRVSQGCEAIPALYHTYGAWPGASFTTCRAALQLGGASQLPGAFIHLRLYRVLFFFPFSLCPHLPLAAPHSYPHFLFLFASPLSHFGLWL